MAKRRPGRPVRYTQFPRRCGSACKRTKLLQRNTFAESAAQATNTRISAAHRPCGPTARRRSKFPESGTRRRPTAAPGSLTRFRRPRHGPSQSGTEEAGDKTLGTGLLPIGLASGGGTMLAMVKPIDIMLHVLISKAIAKLITGTWISNWIYRLPGQCQQDQRRRGEGQADDHVAARIVWGRSGVAPQTLEVPPSR